MVEEERYQDPFYQRRIDLLIFPQQYPFDPYNQKTRILLLMEPNTLISTHINPYQLV